MFSLANKHLLKSKLETKTSKPVYEQCSKVLGITTFKKFLKPDEKSGISYNDSSERENENEKTSSPYEVFKIFFPSFWVPPLIF